MKISVIIAAEWEYVACGALLLTVVWRRRRRVAPSALRTLRFREQI